MYEDGYQNIANIDISKVVVAQLDLCVGCPTPIAADGVLVAADRRLRGTAIAVDVVGVRFEPTRSGAMSKSCAAREACFFRPIASLLMLVQTATQLP